MYVSSSLSGEIGMSCLRCQMTSRWEVRRCIWTICVDRATDWNISALLQVTNYTERVSRPGDFATLRQKNKDGMYTALEQFEVRFLSHPWGWFYLWFHDLHFSTRSQNDVYMVFQRAITMNGHDTVPFREVHRSPSFRTTSHSYMHGHSDYYLPSHCIKPGETFPDLCRRCHC